MVHWSLIVKRKDKPRKEGWLAKSQTKERIFVVSCLFRGGVSGEFVHPPIQVLTDIVEIIHTRSGTRLD